MLSETTEQTGSYLKQRMAVDSSASVADNHHPTGCRHSGDQTLPQCESA